MLSNSFAVESYHGVGKLSDQYRFPISSTRTSPPVAMALACSTNCEASGIAFSELPLLAHKCRRRP